MSHSLPFTVVPDATNEGSAYDFGNELAWDTKDEFEEADIADDMRGICEKCNEQSGCLRLE